jgi:hypothetical protein
VTSERFVPNRRKIAHETIDDEVIIIDLETGTYYSLIESAMQVWTVLAQGATRAQLVDALAAQYDTPSAELADALNPFVDELLREEIIVAEAGEATPITPGPKVAKPFAAPALSRFTNMSDLLLLDPIHDVDEQGWPSKRSA